MGASPAAAIALTRMNAEIDVRHILPTIRVPTLVLHRTGDRTPAGRGGTLRGEPDPQRHVRRAAGRRSPAVCRRSGRAPRRNRALSRRRPHPGRCRPRAGDHAVRRAGAAAADAQRGHGGLDSSGSAAWSSIRRRASGAIPFECRMAGSWWYSTVRPAPSGVGARSAPKRGDPASACGSACTPVSAT